MQVSPSGVLDHHLNKIGCTAGDVYGELVFAERRYHVALDLRRPATIQLEKINVVGRACGHSVELDCVAAPKDETPAADRFERDPSQPLLKLIHQAWRSSGNRSSHRART